MRPERLRILICGVLPPPYFGHSMLYESLMSSGFVKEFDVLFLNMHFWSYQTDTKVTGGKIFKLFIYYSKYLWLLIAFRPKLVLYNTSFYRMPFVKDFLFCATGMMFGRRVVIHDHGQYVKELYGSLSGQGQAMLRWLLKRMTASIIMGERVRPYYEGLVDSSKLCVVPGSVYDSRPIVTNSNRSSSGINILYFSYMSLPKGVNVAFAAARQILQESPSAYFTFAGPLASEEIKTELERLQVDHPGRVLYMGYVGSNVERTALFRGADIYFFPTMRDVFGLVLLHAMAEGVPIVASWEGTIPEIVRDGVDGFLFEKGNAKAAVEKISALLRDESLRRRMGASGRQRYEERFTLEAYGRLMTDVIRRASQ